MVHGLGRAPGSGADARAVLHACTVRSHGDHRIAMAAAVGATAADGPVEVRGANAVAKSYPGFFADFLGLGGEASVEREAVAGEAFPPPGRTERPSGACQKGRDVRGRRDEGAGLAMSSTYGHSVRVQIFGQSHSAAVGVVVDGLPAGEPVDLEGIAAFMARRAPGGTPWSTPRKEADEVEVLSGLNPEGRTCGAPLALLIAQHQHPLEGLLRAPAQAASGPCRPYGVGTLARGAGRGGRGPLLGPAHRVRLRSRWRCACRSSAGAACTSAPTSPAWPASPMRHSTRSRSIPRALAAPGAKPFPVLDDEAGRAMQAAVAGARAGKDSVGGVVECAALGMPAGVGAPMFDGLENRIAQAVFGIPAVKGLEFGAGFAAAGLYGSQDNDPWRLGPDGRVRAATNNAGGILGGISTGMPLVFRAAFKPTSSIFLRQETVDVEEACEAELALVGRHDPCVAVRAVPVVEAACALALADALADDGLLGPVSDLGRDPAELRRLERLFGDRAGWFGSGA